jgi:hypothetical protein
MKSKKKNEHTVLSNKSNEVGLSAEAEAKGVEMTQDFDAMKTHITSAAQYQVGSNQVSNRQSISLNINDHTTAAFN